MRQLKISKSITEDGSPILGIYFQEISKTPLLKKDEEISLVKKIKEGDPRALGKLVNANLRFVVSVAKQYQHRGLSLLDLISEGNFGLLKAAYRFDETKGFKFISYAVWWIRQCILNALNTQSGMIRIPLNKIGALSKIRKAASTFEQDNEREPTANELSEEMAFSEKEINDTINTPIKFSSLDSHLGANPENSSLIDVLKNPDESSIDDYIINESLKTDITRMLSKLNVDERDIIKMSFGIQTNNALSLDEIGNKYHLTKERVRQIQKTAINKLKKIASALLKYPYITQNALN